MVFIMNPVHCRVHTNAPQIDFQQGNSICTIVHRTFNSPFFFPFFFLLLFSLTSASLAISATQTVTKNIKLSLHYFSATNIIIKTTVSQISCLLRGRPDPASSARAPTTLRQAWWSYLRSPVGAGTREAGWRLVTLKESWQSPGAEKSAPASCH